MKYLMLISFYFSALLSYSQEAELNIIIENLEAKGGNLKVNIYNNEKGFPSDYDLAFKTVVKKPESPTDTIKVTLPFGEYAVSVLHDENNNNKMDFEKLILPAEGYGASNDAKAKMGPPKYKDARFSFSTKNTTIKIRMKY